MAAPYSNLQNKHENAMKLVAEDVTLANRGGAAVIIGLSGAVDLVLPRIEVQSGDPGEEYPENTGNFWLDSTVRILSDADDGITNHKSRVAYVVDGFFTDGIAAALSAAAVTDYSCQAVVDFKPEKQTKEDRTIISEFSFRALSCASDL